jgi:hypothetical protein
MKVFLLLLALAGTSLAQPVSLAGPWKLQREDNLRWAQPGIDDSAWPVVNMPGRAMRSEGIYWLRRTVTAPHCDGDCYLTVGLVADTYEVAMFRERV